MSLPVDDSPGITFDTNDDQYDDKDTFNEDVSVERLWEKMYRVCTKELILQGLQFQSYKSKQQIIQMIQNAKNEQMKQELIKQNHNIKQKQKINEDFLTICFKRYLLTYQVFLQVSQPDFYEKYQDDDDE